MSTSMPIHIETNPNDPYGNYPTKRGTSGVLEDKSIAPSSIGGIVTSSLAAAAIGGLIFSAASTRNPTITNDHKIAAYKEAMPDRPYALLSPLIEPSNTIESRLRSNIERSSELLENWDGHGGVVPSEQTITDAIALLAKVAEFSMPDRTGLSSDGEISLFWEREDLFADFGVTGNGKYTYYFNAKGKKFFGDDIPIESQFAEEILTMLT